ncbi:hypothetical protein [Nocardia vaccinii]|uniref:hypothetical protein n=1 Tax=Nocardia vaccinii TaxID=1822 RepID=UPI00082CE1EA|nr:hypothetical protein [Nocardia vaccinii]
MILQDLTDVASDYTGLARKVLEYSLITKRLVDQAKQPGFTIADWAPLAELVATDEFERVGNFKEVMNWTDYTAFLTNWASTSDWECSFKRVTETPDLVFLELEERSRVGEFSSTVNSLSVFEFTLAGKICHIDIYLQMALPDPEMLKSYQNTSVVE